MTPKALPSVAILRADYEYHPDTGVFIHRLSGRVAGSNTGTGYIRIGLRGDYYRAHRLAWLYMTGEPPPEYIDHINGVRADNRWANLRSANLRQNQYNSRKRPGCKSKLKGVWRYPGTNKWRAYIKPNGKAIFLGTFSTEELAHAAYVAAAQKAFGEFARAA